MPKLSKPIQWTLILSLFAVAVVYLLPGNQPAVTSHPRTRHTVQTTDADGISYEDLNAHFPRYSATPRNPFVPLVTPPAAEVVAVPQTIALAPASVTGWSLTGINAVNGSVSALIENSATKDSTFLHVGDTWHGMRVTSIDATGVVLVGATGMPTRLAFVTTVPDTPAPGSGATTITPSVTSVTPLPPMPLAATSRRGRRRGGQADTPAAASGDTSESSDQ